jgi:hypothetical protein
VQESNLQPWAWLASQRDLNLLRHLGNRHGALLRRVPTRLKSSSEQTDRRLPVLVLHRALVRLAQPPLDQRRVHLVVLTVSDRPEDLTNLAFADPVSGHVEGARKKRRMQ